MFRLLSRMCIAELSSCWLFHRPAATVPRFPVSAEEHSACAAPAPQHPQAVHWLSPEWHSPSDHALPVTADPPQRFSQEHPHPQSPEFHSVRQSCQYPPSRRPASSLPQRIHFPVRQFYPQAQCFGYHRLTPQSPEHRRPYRFHPHRQSVLPPQYWDADCHPSPVV